MKYIFHEPTEYAFRDKNGHHGKFFSTDSPTTNHLIIECDDKLTVSLIQHESEFNYYIVEGEGYFIFDNAQQAVQSGDMIVIPPGTKYRFGGKLKMLLINTPHWRKEQEEQIKDAS
jgi:mannose-6-phosphate isomerase-like protein (cupin superfamily)